MRYNYSQLHHSNDGEPVLTCYRIIAGLIKRMHFPLASVYIM